MPLKRTLKIILPPLCYEDALKTPGLILLQQRREDVYITFLKRSYSSSHLLRNLARRVTYTRLYALGTGENLSDCLPLQELIHSAIVAPSYARITVKIPKCVMSKLTKYLIFTLSLTFSFNIIIQHLYLCHN